MSRFPDPLAEWQEWADSARTLEPIFLEAIDRHEHDLNYPGVEIIRNTEPSRRDQRAPDDTLTAALADTDGQQLVQAILDRKQVLSSQ